MPNDDLLPPYPSFEQVAILAPLLGYNLEFEPPTDRPFHRSVLVYLRKCRAVNIKNSGDFRLVAPFVTSAPIDGEFERIRVKAQKTIQNVDLTSDHISKLIFYNEKVRRHFINYFLTWLRIANICSMNSSYRRTDLPKTLRSLALLTNVKPPKENNIRSICSWAEWNEDTFKQEWDYGNGAHVPKWVEVIRNASRVEWSRYSAAAGPKVVTGIPEIDAALESLSKISGDTGETT
jgi:hypothetical protein